MLAAQPRTHRRLAEPIGVALSHWEHILKIRGQVQGRINAVLLRREPQCPRRSRSTRKWQKRKKRLKASHQTGMAVAGTPDG